MNPFDDFDQERLSFSENWASILDQDEFWVNADGEKLRLDEMGVAHCANVVQWIVRSLSRLAERDLMKMTLGPGPSGDMACDAYDSAMAELEHIVVNAGAWAEGTPLVQALKRRARGLIARENEPGDDVYHRIPKSVRAIQYDGTNLDAITAFVDDRNLLVKERRVPGPGRGMQQALVVQSVHISTTVTVGSWLLSEDGRYSSMPDEIFEQDYRKGNTE